MEHTQGKLRTRNKELVAYEGYASTVIGQANSLANAKRLVKCWNGYDDLVTALRLAKTILACQSFQPYSKAMKLINTTLAEAEKD